MKISSVALFCGSATGSNPLYAELASRFGQMCAQKGLTLYYGGGSIGLMGEAANAAMANGGTVIGVAPDFFKQGAVLADNITEMIFVKTMSERKQLLESRADAFVVLPGGYGTVGFLRLFHHELLITANTLEELFTGLDNYQNSNDRSWLEKVRH